MKVESGTSVKTGGWVHKLDDPLPERVAPPPRKIDYELWRNRCAEAYRHKLAGKVRAEEAERLGLSPGILDRLYVGAGVDAKHGVYSTWPQRDGKARFVGYCRRFSDGTKMSEKGGKQGLFYLLHWYLSAGPLFVVEGGSDVAALAGIGAVTIGRFSNVGGADMIATAWNGLTKKPQIVVVGEMDEKPHKRGTLKSCKLDCPGCSNCWPGKYGAIHTAVQLSSALGVDVRWAMCPDGCKDAREWASKNRGASVIDWIEDMKGGVNVKVSQARQLLMSGTMESEVRALGGP